MNTPTQRLMRSQNEKVIAGVAGGIAHYLAIDPVIIRLAFIALCFTGVGVLLYPILWVIMPQASTSNTADFANSGREVYVAHDSTPRRPRFDPMSGDPIDSEEIPINNIPSADQPTTDPVARRNQLLGYALLIVGAVVLFSSIAGLSGLVAKLLFPAILIGIGIYMLRRN